MGGYSRERSLDYFMDTLRSGKRKLVATWEFNPPKNNIESIKLQPIAFVYPTLAIKNTGTVVVDYYFSNFLPCWREIKARKGANL